MSTRSSRLDRSLLRMKLALAAGGLITTFIGAGLLGRQAAALSPSVDVVAGISSASEARVAPGVESIDLPGLNLNLEAVPTIAAQPFRGRVISFGRSSR